MKPNIIFILLDGSRWDRLDRSPEFKELKKKGTLLNNVTTAAPYTFASMNVIFTGLYGKENGVDAYYKMFRLKDNVSFLPEILKNNGYFTSCDLITEKVISSRGFDIYRSHNEYEDKLNIRHPNLIKESFTNAEGRPVFSFLQFSRIHTVTVSEVLKQYEWNDERFYKKQNENLEKYDKVFLETSIYATKIYETVKELGKLENTILIFFSDHGTGIGERFGERNYGVFTYEETIRTFYLFIGPMIKKNQISDSLLSTIDILPTLLDLIKVKTDKNYLGNSVSPFICGESNSVKEREFTFSETGGLQGPFPSPKEPNVFCLKTPKYKLIYFKATKEWKLFDISKDPLEQKNLIGKRPSQEEKLKEKLLEWVNR